MQRILILESSRSSDDNKPALNSLSPNKELLPSGSTGKVPEENNDKNTNGAKRAANLTEMK